MNESWRVMACAANSAENFREFSSADVPGADDGGPWEPAIAGRELAKLLALISSQLQTMGRSHMIRDGFVEMRDDRGASIQMYLDSLVGAVRDELESEWPQIVPHYLTACLSALTKAGNGPPSWREALPRLRIRLCYLDASDTEFLVARDLGGGMGEVVCLYYEGEMLIDCGKTWAEKWEVPCEDLILLARRNVEAEAGLEITRLEDWPGRIYALEGESYFGAGQVWRLEELVPEGMVERWLIAPATNHLVLVAPIQDDGDFEEVAGCMAMFASTACSEGAGSEISPVVYEVAEGRWTPVCCDEEGWEFDL